jgi:CheY-like chemotaxis protein
MQHINRLRCGKPIRSGESDFGAPMRGCRMLLAEDNPLFLDALTEDMRARGHEVRPCMRAQDIFRLIPLLEPDVIVADIIMREFDILDAIPKLRRISPMVKIVVMSANPHLTALAPSHGVHGVLAKPFESWKLDHLIRNLIP